MPWAINGPAALAPETVGIIKNGALIKFNHP
jgi:hypothetical protein